jgi:hypothetical protein
MPTNLEAKKARKKPRKPQQIPEATWVAIEKAVVACMGFSEASRAFNVDVHAVMMRSRRNRWPVGSRIQRRAEALQEARYKAHDCYKSYEDQRTSNTQAIEALAQNWAQKGEAHRALAFSFAHSELKAASKRGLPIEDWSGAEKADRMARKACGLDSEEGARISIGLALVNERLDVIAETLPKVPD